ncbi:MAG: N-6 DNA methylase [Candidatus Aminicenantes bacterium]|nr:N-6 DNA methylase [Candidatus Aminicenantes bacterium]
MKELIQETLWRKASRIRKDNDGVDAMLWGPGLVFLKCMSHAFDRMFLELKIDEIGGVLDEAMEVIERINPTVQQILPREYASPDIRPDQLALFIKMLGDIPKEYYRTGEILQGVFGYFVRNYLSAGDKRQESICTPECIDKLVVAMVGPMKGKIFDPCCGVAGMLVESHAFLLRNLHLANTSLKNLVKETDPMGLTNPMGLSVFYGQESKLTNFRLCRMNLAIHGIDGTQVGWNNESCLDKDLHPNLKADYLFCVPPLNSRYSEWMRYIVSHLAPGGVAGVILSKDSLSGSLSTPAAAVNGDDALENPGVNTRVSVNVNCIVTLPDQLFQSTGMSACLWLLGRGKGRISGAGKQDGDILFIDAASNIPGVPRKLRREELSNAEIDEIAGTFRRWQAQNGDYKDVKGFCKSLEWKTIKGNRFNLTPERYV